MKENHVEGSIKSIFMFTRLKIYSQSFTKSIKKLWCESSGLKDQKCIFLKTSHPSSSSNCFDINRFKSYVV